ncbi:MAG: hypothetical protein ACYTF1_26915, partial [Planctomycetota bacterium]
YGAIIVYLYYATKLYLKLLIDIPATKTSAAPNNKLFCEFIYIFFNLVKVTITRITGRLLISKIALTISATEHSSFARPFWEQ